MANVAPTSLVLLATIGAAHGVKGEVRVKSFTEDPLGLSNFGLLSTEDGRRLKIERVRAAKKMLIAKFAGIDDRNAAEALNGVSLYVDRNRLPAPDADEFYHADLIGLVAESDAGEALGCVVGVHNFGAGDILEIAPADGPALMVPFTKETVPSLDVADGRLTIVPPLETPDEQTSEKDTNQ